MTLTTDKEAHVTALHDTPISRRRLTERGWGATLLAPTAEDTGVLAVRLDPHPHTTALAFLVGVHGGAGLSCLAAQLDHLADGGRAWPGREDDESPYTLLVARETLSGLTALHTVLRSYVAGTAPAHVQLVGLVIVADSPDKPAPVVRQKRELCERVVGSDVPIYRIGWHSHFVSTEIAALPSAGPGTVPDRRWNRKRQPPRDVLELGNHTAAAILAVL